MAFPTIQSADTQANHVTSNSSSWTLTYPTNLASGDLILAFAAIDGGTVASWPTGWIKYDGTSGSATNLHIAAKVSDGTESGTFSLSLSGSEQGSWRIVRITGWYGTITSNTTFGNNSIDVGVAATSQTGSGNNRPQPPALDPAGWATEDTLWFAVCAADTSRSITDFPGASWNDQYQDASGGSNGATLGMCWINGTQASQSPLNYLISANDDWEAATVGIRPAGSTGTTARGHAQALARIKQVYRGFAQANSDIKATSNKHSQSQADIRQSYRGYAQSLATIVKTSFGLSQAQGSIKAISNGYANAQADIKAISNAFGQALADIKQSYRATAQAQAQITVTYTFSGNALADIKAIGRGYGQALGLIRGSHLGVGQALASIRTVYNASGQAQSQIRATYLSHGNSGALIRSTGRGVGQAQALILTTVNAFGLAQSTIIIIGQGFAQAGSQIAGTINTLYRLKIRDRESVTLNLSADKISVSTYDRKTMTLTLSDRQIDLSAQEQGISVVTYDRDYY